MKHITKIPLYIPLNKLENYDGASGILEIPIGTEVEFIKYGDENEVYSTDPITANCYTVKDYGIVSKFLYTIKGHPYSFYDVKQNDFGPKVVGKIDLSSKNKLIKTPTKIRKSPIDLIEGTGIIGMTLELNSAQCENLSNIYKALIHKSSKEVLTKEEKSLLPFLRIFKEFKSPLDTDIWDNFYPEKENNMQP